VPADQKPVEIQLNTLPGAPAFAYLKLEGVVTLEHALAIIAMLHPET
jgi:hypothetical protein